MVISTHSRKAMHLLLPGAHNTVSAQNGVAGRLDAVLVPSAPAVEREQNVLLQLASKGAVSLTASRGRGLEAEKSVLQRRGGAVAA